MVPQLFSTTEAAAYLGVTRRRVLQLVDAGRLVPIGKTSAGYVFEQDALDRTKARYRGRGPTRRPRLRSEDTDGDRSDR